MNDTLQGIVVSYQEYREYDALLSVLSESGRLYKISARGIQKIQSKNAAACQLFTYTRMMLNYKATASLQSLKTAEVIISYRNLREDLQKQAMASYFCEAMLKSDFATSAAFQLLKQCLNHLQEESDTMPLLCLFQALINRMHGVDMNCEECVRCKTKHGIQAVSLSDGGFVCKNCSQIADHTYPSQALKQFRLLSKADMKHYELIRKQGSFHFTLFLQLYAFFEEYTGIKLHSAKFLSILQNMENTMKKTSSISK